MRHLFLAILLTLPLAADEKPDAAVDQLLDRIVAREKTFLDTIRGRAPIIETYIQETPDTTMADAHPNKDHYFLGRFRLGDTVTYEALVDRTEVLPKAGSRLGVLRLHAAAPKNPGMAFLPRGFAQMSIIDLHDFNRQTYAFEYVRREFLGEVRCLVFDVKPIIPMPGKFLGRIWVEDRDDSVVRFNGTYIQAPEAKGTVVEHYFHFDSWRVNVLPGMWVPAQIYIEEEAAATGKGNAGTPRFKAQTRIWDYAASPAQQVGRTDQYSDRDWIGGEGSVRVEG